MRISAPEPNLRASDKKTLKLIAEVLLQAVSSDVTSIRVIEDVAVLSDKQAAQLLRSLETLLESREFLERNHLIEMLTGNFEKLEKSAKEIFFRGKKRGGRSSPWVGRQWSQFCVRFGLKDVWGFQPAVSYMSYQDFVRFEERLAVELDLHPRVINLLLKMLSEVNGSVEEARRGKVAIKASSIRKIIVDTVRQLKPQMGRKNNGIILDKTRLISIWTLLGNGSVMFTTRDWGVAGTVSTIAGALIGSVSARK